MRMEFLEDKVCLARVKTPELLQQATCEILKGFFCVFLTGNNVFNIFRQIFQDEHTKVKIYRICIELNCG